jgi:hypothetical protein
MFIKIIIAALLLLLITAITKIKISDKIFIGVLLLLAGTVTAYGYSIMSPLEQTAFMSSLSLWMQ